MVEVSAAQTIHNQLWVVTDVLGGERRGYGGKEGRGSMIARGEGRGSMIARGGEGGGAWLLGKGGGGAWLLGKGEEVHGC